MPCSARDLRGVFEQPDTPDSCARCGAPAVVPIVYGLPDEALEQAATRGEVALGGCIIPQPQRWGCRVCGYTWPLPPEALAGDLAGQAFALAAAAHRGGQGLEHTVAVAHLLYEEGYGEPVVAAGLLHDVMVHACIGVSDLEARFGHDVAALVDVLTEDTEIGDYEKRKLVHRAQVRSADRRAAGIYAADALSSMRMVRAAYARDGECVTKNLEASLDAVVVNAERDVRMLERFAPPLPFVNQLAEEVKGLRADRAAGRRTSGTATCPA